MKYPQNIYRSSCGTQNWGATIMEKRVLEYFLHNYPSTWSKAPLENQRFAPLVSEVLLLLFHP